MSAGLAYFSKAVASDILYILQQLGFIEKEP